MILRLWLVRHGSTDWSEAGRLTGWTDVPLNDRGRAQARGLAQVLGQQSFIGAWSSDLIRAVETAQLASVDAVLDPRLREVDFGQLEGVRWDEIPSPTREALREFDGFQAPGGESVAGLRQRVAQFTHGLGEGDHVLFTHGGVIRALLRQAGQDRWVGPCAVARLTVNSLPGSAVRGDERRFEMRGELG